MLAGRKSGWRGDYSAKIEQIGISDHFQRVLVGQPGERGGRQGLIPEGDRGDVVLQRQVAAVTLGAPAERLNGDAQILLEAHWVGDVPAVEAEALLRSVDAIGPDHLRHARVGGGELAVLALLAAVDNARVEVVGAAEVVFRAGAADGRELGVAVHEELDLALAPPA